MKIKYVKIENYRNLSGIEIHLHSDVNFLVGENDIGKSNFLDMLDILFNRKSFSEENYFDKSKPIIIEFQLSLNDNEIGIFKDYFDPKNANLINIIANQETPDDYIRYLHKESSDEILYSKFRCLNFIKYDSLRTPKEEFSLYRRRGVGKFLNYLSEKFIKANKELFESEMINEEISSKLTKYFNDRIGKLKMFKEFKLNITVEEDTADLLCRILSIIDDNGYDLTKTGYGVQFSLLIDLTILQKLISLKKYKNRRECLFEDNNNVSISLILGLDEPEIHLHPYMQRNIIKYINEITKNKNNDFSLLIKEIFDVDEILGQSIVVTQSPNILLDDYRNFIRFYETESKLYIVNGSKVNLGSDIEKHLLKQLPYIKEAFFSKGIILVEGDTELGAVPLWAEKLSMDLDELGISIIKADSKNSVPKIMELLNKFGINNIGIIDRDEDFSKYNDIDNLFITHKRDFEEELVDILITDDQNLIENLLSEYEIDEYEGIIIQNNKLEKIASKYKINVEFTKQNYKFSDVYEDDNQRLLKVWLLSWLDLNKGVILGRTIGKIISEDKIPRIYKEVLQEAENIS